MLTGVHPFAVRYARPDAETLSRSRPWSFTYSEIASRRQPAPSLAEYVNGRPLRPDITPAWVAAVDSAIAIDPSYRAATSRALAEMVIRGSPHGDAIARLAASSLYEIAAVEDKTTREGAAATSIAAPRGGQPTVTARSKPRPRPKLGDRPDGLDL